jgi:hypothetical protein
MKKNPAIPIELMRNTIEASFQWSFKFVLVRAKDKTTETPLHNNAPERTSWENGEYW